jgi:adenylate cyclase
MGKEIERKFLLNPVWKKLVGVDYVLVDTIKIKQGYIAYGDGRSVRVRLSKHKSSGIETGYITIKGKTKGITKPEYEYAIPVSDAKEMLKSLCTGDLVEKTRYVYDTGSDDLCWEIDVFRSNNAGLVVAEIEIRHPRQRFPIPNWLGVEVTNDKRYSNLNLSKKPFKLW